MSTLKVNTIQDTSGSNGSTSEQISKGRAKVWVNFKGSGTLTVNESFKYIWQISLTINFPKGVIHILRHHIYEIKFIKGEREGVWPHPLTNDDVICEILPRVPFPETFKKFVCTFAKGPFIKYVVKKDKQTERSVRSLNADVIFKEYFQKRKEGLSKNINFGRRSLWMVPWFFA